MNRKILVIPLVAAALGLQGLGCGGSDEATAISQPDFIASANQICAEAVEGQTAAFKRIGGEVEGKQLTPSEQREKESEFVGEVAATVETMIDEFEELGAPAGKEDAVAKMLEQYESGASKAEADPQVFLTGKAFLAADKSAKGLGLTRCEGM